MATKRNYKSEYQNYHSSEKQKKNRAARNAARAEMMKKGKVKKGDGKDVTHKNGNPRDNSSKNLGVSSEHAGQKRRKYTKKKSRVYFHLGI